MCKTSLFVKQEKDVIPSKVKSNVLKRDTDIGNAHTSTSRDKSAELDGLHSNRKSELDRKEAYLMQLEADLLKKEKEIREKICLAPSVAHKTLKDIDEVRDQAEKSVDTGSAKHQVDIKLPNITQLLADDINIVGRFVQVCSQLHLLLGVIRRMINNATRFVNTLRLEFSFFYVGHSSPNLLSPEELRKVLFQIRSKIWSMS